MRDAIRGRQTPVAGERKQVTVLFCDLANSTEIADQLDPEEYRELLDRYLELLFPEIERFDGVVNQLAGDGVMALFGAPVAHEDAPARAVRAALAIQDALGRFSDDLDRERGLELRARIGIHTGLAVVGTVGTDSKMDYTAIGDTTNLASRLESHARPGNVLVSQETHRLVEGLFRVRAVGPFPVRGRREPITAYEVIEAREVVGSPALERAKSLTPLVGREGHLSQLEACFRQLSSGLAQMVSVIGDAGSGKSRLLYEFKRRMADEPMILLEGRCSSLGQSVPYSPWISMLERHFGLERGEPTEEARAKIESGIREWDPELTRIYPFLCRLLSVPAESIPDLPPEEFQARTFAGLAELIFGLSLEKPVVLILEELHWIDDPSMRVLEKAAANLGKARIMLVVSHRPDFQPSWQVKTALTQLRIGPLTDVETSEIVRMRAGGALPRSLEQRILEKAEGNPFYAEELTKVLLESGYLVPDQEEVRLTRPVAEIPIPGTVHELLGARLDRLGPTAKRVAQTASVIGREFRACLLEDLLDGEGIDVGRELEELDRRGVIRSGGDLPAGVFRFGESLTHEFAYESLLLRERRRLHEQVARALEGTCAEPAMEHTVLVAHHYARSENRMKAIQALLEAAREAEALPSYTTLGHLAREAWALSEAWLEEAGEKREEDLRAVVEVAYLLVRHNVFGRADDPAALQRAMDRGREIAQELEDPVRVAGFDTLEGMVLLNGDPESFSEGMRLVERGLRNSEESGPGVSSQRVRRVLAWGHLLDARFESALRLIEEATVGLEKLGGRDALSDTYLGARYFQDRILYQAGLVERSEGTNLETLELSRRAGNRTVETGSLATLALSALSRGELGQALEYATECLTISEEIGNRASGRVTSSVALIATIESGGEARADHLEILNLVVEASSNDLDSQLVVEALLCTGRPEQAARVAEESRRRSSGRLRQLQSELAHAQVLALAGAAQKVLAEEAYARVISTAESIDVSLVLAPALLGAGDLALARGDSAHARDLLGRCLKLSRELGLARFGIRAERLLGLEAPATTSPA